MKILIIGSGVYGMMAGAALSENGVDVSMLVRPSRQKQLITQSVKITSPFGRFTAPLKVVAPRALGGPYDVAIVAARANVYQMALFVARDAIGPETSIVSLFDGVDHIDLWRERYPHNAVALACFELRASMDADGVVRQTGPMGRLELGLLYPSGTERLEAIAAAMNGRRFHAALNADTLHTRVWARHVFLAAAAGATRLSGIPSLRDTLRYHSAKPYEDMLKEGTVIGEARGLPRLFHAVQRYRHAFLKESEPVMAPVPLASGGRASDEAFFLLGNLLRKAQDKKVAAPTLMRAWEMTTKSAAAGACVVAVPA